MVIVNATPEQEKKLLQAIELLKKVVRLEAFENDFVPGGDWDFWVMFYYNGESTAAGTANPELKRIRLNTKYFDKDSLENVCATIAHEYAHIIGFHDEVVPKEIGSLVRTLAKNYKSNLKKRIFWFWWEWAIIKIGDVVFAMISLPFLPLAFFLKHKLKINVPPFSWMLNDDSDFGADWWLERERLKPGLWSAARWWWRNKTWNFRLLFGQVDHSDPLVLKVVKHEFGKSAFDWSESGVNHIYYEIEGKLYGRYSYGNNWISIHLGQAGIGDEPKVLRIKKSTL